jgi:hypothetical protein
MRRFLAIVLTVATWIITTADTWPPGTTPPGP